MTDSYNQRNINLQGQQAVSTLIFDSNASSQSDIVFTDWNALLAKARETPGIVDITVGPGTSTVPAGTYDLTGIRLKGLSAFATLDITDAVFQNMLYVESLILATGISSANSVSSLQYGAGAADLVTIIDSNFLTGVNATVPLVDITGGVTIGWAVRGSGFFSNNPGVPCIAIDGTSTLGATTLSGVGGNAWGGNQGDDAFVSVAAGGTFNLGLGTGDVFWSADQTGTVTVARFDDYESAVLANWNGVEPLNVKNALDRIAAAVGPIA